MSAPHQIAQPIVFSPRPEVVDAVRGELKAIGTDGIQVAAKTEACIEMLMMQPGVPLVLDWAHGAEAVNQILGAVRGFFKIETRPIFLLIPEIEPTVVATGIEYGVAQIHSGPISRAAIRACLTELLTVDEGTQAVLDGLIQVASARRNDDWASSLPILQELHRQHPGNKRVLMELAEGLIHVGSWQEAMALLEPLTTEPPHIRALHLLGRCYMQAKDFDSAIGLLSRAKLINPSNIERLIELGDAFLANDQAPEAVTNYQEALALDKDSVQAKHGLGTSLLINGEINEALSLFNASSGPRELASIFNTSAIIAMRFGRFDQGMQLYRSALKALGREDVVAARLMFNMGLGYRRWGKPDKAQVCFEKSLVLDPTFSKAAKYQKGAPAHPSVEAARDLDDDEMALHETIIKHPSGK
jgi:tetratricopeptide (TPR) repeat protein